MSRTHPIWVGFDLGGTRIKGGAMDAHGKVVARDVEATSPGQSTRDLERQLNALIARLVETSGGTLAGIGASITGPVDPQRGCLYLPGKISGLAKHPTVPYLRKRWNVPVIADNDGRMATFGEWRAGAGKGVDNLLVLTMGTGIGSGVVLEGRLLTDRHFQRGTQCGHLVIQVNGARCLTGARGTGESLASVTALVQDVRGALARGLPLWLPKDTTPATISFPDIVAAVRHRDPMMTEIFDAWLDRFAVVLLNAYYAYVPDLILLAGGPTKAAPVFLRKLQQRLNTDAFRVPLGYNIPVRVAHLGEDAGWIGAALMLQENHRP